MYCCYIGTSVHGRLNRPSDIQKLCGKVKDETPFKNSHFGIGTQKIKVIGEPYSRKETTVFIITFRCENKNCENWQSLAQRESEKIRIRLKPEIQTDLDMFTTKVHNIMNIVNIECKHGNITSDINIDVLKFDIHNKNK